MATALVELAASTTTEVVAAQANQIIRVKQIVAQPGTAFDLKSDTTVIGPRVQASSGSTLDLNVSDAPFCTARGEALNATSSVASAKTIWVLYDVVS